MLIGECVDECTKEGERAHMLCEAAMAAYLILLWGTDLIWKVSHVLILGKVASLSMLGAWPRLIG